MVLIVVWNRMWDIPLQIPEELPAGCSISLDRDLAREADAVVFHLPSLNPDVILNGSIAKSAGQLWVAWSMESEVHCPWLSNAHFMQHFDIRMTHRLDSEIPTTYVPGNFQSRLIDGSSRPRDFGERREVLANAFISSNVDRSGRVQLLTALMDRMAVDSFGRVARTVHPPEGDNGASFKLETIAGYKFTLAFDNACALDYVTEKFFQPLLAGSVPVVLGAPNVAEFAPGENCYVDVRDFPTVSALVHFMQAVGSDRDAYERFHAWRSRPLRRGFLKLMERERTHPFVRLCRLLLARSPSRAAS